VLLQFHACIPDKNRMMETTSLKLAQRSWAIAKGIGIDRDGYCRDTNANLFQKPSESSRSELERGDGNELGKPGLRGKIQALHSSAALACNFFDYWRTQDLDPLARAFGISAKLCGLEFEKKYPTGVGRTAPNLDVVLFGADGMVFAIESKFTEWTSRSKNKNWLSPRYFPEGRALWSQSNLPGCQSLADDLHSGQEPFKILDAAQLLKHMLGLGHSCKRWKLICLWYRPLNAIADLHASELEKFTERIGADAEKFKALTYQTLFSLLSVSCKEKHAGWKTYMDERYFHRIPSAMPGG
jgi:hypothetical protein